MKLTKCKIVGLSPISEVHCKDGSYLNKRIITVEYKDPTALLMEKPDSILIESFTRKGEESERLYEALEKGHEGKLRFDIRVRLDYYTTEDGLMKWQHITLQDIAESHE